MIPAFISENLHIVVPFLLAAAGGAVARLLGGGRGEVLAQALLPAAFLAGAAVVWGGWPSPLPGWRPFSLVPWLVLAALLAGLALALLGGRRGARLAALVVLAVASSWLVAGRPLPPDWGGLALAAAALAAALVALARLDALAPMAPAAPVMLAAAALGLLGLAWLDGAHTTAALAAALTAAAAGHLLVAWLLGVAFGAPAALGGGVALVALAQAAVLAGPLPAVPVLLLLLVFFADGTAARLTVGSGLLRRLLAPAVLAAVCLIPLALALVAGWVAANLHRL